MKLLLDTHVVLFLAQEPDRVPAATRAEIERAEVRVLCAATAYEIAYKSRLGKLPRGRELIAGWDLLRRSLLASEHPLSVEDMVRAGELDWEHRDPFDRMLVAHAQVEGLVLVTADRALRAFPDVTTIWG